MRFCIPNSATEPEPVLLEKIREFFHPTMQTYVKKFLTAKAGKSHSTVAGYRRSLEHFIQVAGDDWPPDEDAIQEFFITAAQSLSRSTVYGRYKTLKVFFNWCVKRRILKPDENPMRYIEQPPKPPELIPRAPREEYVDKLLGWLGDQARASIAHGVLTNNWTAVRDFAIVSFLCGTGVRVGELEHVEVDDLELDLNRAYLSETKTNIARYVLFSEQVREDLELWLSVRDTLPVSHITTLFVSDVVHSKKDWHAFTHTGVRQMLIRKCEKLGIEPYLNPHAFRHYWAIQTLRRGGSLLDVRNQLGHRDIATTNRYLTAAGVDVKLIGSMPR